MEALVSFIIVSLVIAEVANGLGIILTVDRTGSSGFGSSYFLYYFRDGRLEQYLSSRSVVISLHMFLIIYDDVDDKKRV